MSFIGKTIKYVVVYPTVGVVGFVGLAALVGQASNTPEAIAERVAECHAKVGAENCTDKGYRTEEYTAKLNAEYEAKKAQREKEAAEAKVLAEAENKRKGFHCLSPWDGSHRQVARTVENSMRNPDSFDHVETRITPVKDGQHVLTMKYRGQNGFGGMSLESVIATIDNKTCTALSVAKL